MKSVVVYPTGFIGYDVGFPVVRNEANVDAANALVRFASVSTKDKLVMANNTIEGLYTQWHKRTRKVGDADYLSDVYAACMNAFGTNSFYEWAYMQLENPYFTASHREFLNDMFSFILTGKRTYSYSAWAVALERRRADSEDKKTPYNYRDLIISGTPLTVTDAVTRWSAHDGGVEDMITSLHLVFGDVE